MIYVYAIYYELRMEMGLNTNAFLQKAFAFFYTFIYKWMVLAYIHFMVVRSDSWQRVKRMEKGLNMNAPFHKRLEAVTH